MFVDWQCNLPITSFIIRHSIVVIHVKRFHWFHKSSGSVPFILLWIFHRMSLFTISPIYSVSIQIMHASRTEIFQKWKHFFSIISETNIIYIHYNEFCNVRLLEYSLFCCTFASVRALCVRMQYLDGALFVILHITLILLWCCCTSHCAWIGIFVPIKSMAFN